MEQRHETHDTHSSARTAALVVVVLLGPAFGVATDLWRQALLLLGLGTLLIIAPPRRTPGRVWSVISIVLIAIALTAFLPARWLPVPEWRKTLTGDFRVELPRTFSPQPWVSAHAVCLFFAALVLTLYLSTRSWSSHTRRQAARWYVGGVVMLAVVALVSFVKGWHPPIWPDVLNSMNGFGIFPNRNQTADVFALAGIMAVALAFDGFKRKKKGAWFWIVALFILGAAVTLTTSRAGVLIFFGGMAVWNVLSYTLSGSRKAGSLTLAGLALLITGFLVFGGGTFRRVQALAQDTTPEYRVAIQKDALHFAATAPWLGQSIGNFEPVFAMARVASADQNRAHHPESDWLWVAVEMGWPAVALIAIGVALWLRKCLPLSQGSDRSLRAAAMVCGIFFALHSLGDVSAHRPGSGWPGLFLAGLAVTPPGIAPRSRWAAPVFRMLGVVLVLISGWWFASIFSERVGRAAPTPATIARLSARAEQQNIEKDYTAALTSANEALRVTPLDADLYYQRARARTGRPFGTWAAAWDFGTARFLDAHSIKLCIEEGKRWADAGQQKLAFDAWVEAFRRAGKEAPEHYRRMLEWSQGRPAAHAMLGRLARNSPDFLIVFLAQASSADCELLIGQLVESDPTLKNLSSEQRKKLFSIWNWRGDRRLLFEKLRANPEWQKEGWRALAVLQAEAKDFKSACEIVRDSLPRPSMPKLPETRPLSELERMFRSRPDDITLGLQLRNSQLSIGKTQDALETLRALQSLPNHPAYLDYLEADQFEESEDWEHAWLAWARYARDEFK